MIVSIPLGSNAVKRAATAFHSSPERVYWSLAPTPRFVARAATAEVMSRIGWLFGPLKWWWRNGTLRKLIFGRREFILVYQPEAGYSKPVVFLDNGQIGADRNNNEDTWRIRRGCLEFLADDGKVYSRFRLDKASRRLACTNDPDLRSLFGQYLSPQY